MPDFDSVYRVIRRRGEPEVRSLDAYRRAGGYAALEKAVREQTPEQVIQQVLDAKLRGRGGAGRPTGEKWRIVRRQDDNIKYVFAMLTMQMHVRGLCALCWSAIRTRLSRASCFQLTQSERRKRISSHVVSTLKRYASDAPTA